MTYNPRFASPQAFPVPHEMKVESGKTYVRCYVCTQDLFIHTGKGSVQCLNGCGDGNGTATKFKYNAYDNTLEPIELPKGPVSAKERAEINNNKDVLNFKDFKSFKDLNDFTLRRW